jgi:hypothetical protein
VSKLLIASALFFAGCTKEAVKLPEDNRTMFFVSCVNGGFKITTCECIEAALTSKLSLEQILSQPPCCEAEISKAIIDGIESCKKLQK